MILLFDSRVFLDGFRGNSGRYLARVTYLRVGRCGTDGSPCFA